MSETLTRYHFYYPGTHHGLYHADAAMGENTDGEWVKVADVEALLDDPQALAQAVLARQEPIDGTRFEQAPCYLCGYNNGSYFQPEQHPCAERYHALRQQLATVTQERDDNFTALENTIEYAKQQLAERDVRIEQLRQAPHQWLPSASDQEREEA